MNLARANTQLLLLVLPRVWDSGLCQRRATAPIAIARATVELRIVGLRVEAGPRRNLVAIPVQDLVDLRFRGRELLE